MAKKKVAKPNPRNEQWFSLYPMNVDDALKKALNTKPDKSDDKKKPKKKAHDQ